MKLIQSVKCLCGYHETYSKADDLDYNFQSCNLHNLGYDDTIKLFFDLTALRCRHCDYIFDGAK